LDGCAIVASGPKDTTTTRFNAAKHGLLAAGVTELDDAEGYRDTLRDLTKEKDPLGQVETFLVRCAALDMIRWRRAGRLEAEYITEMLHPPIHAPGTAAFFSQVREPSRKARVASKCRQFAKDLQKRFLGKLFRLCGIVRHTQTQGMNSPLVSVKQRGKRIRVTLLGTSYGIGFHALAKITTALYGTRKKTQPS
jgi:hypothetical protein